MRSDRQSLTGWRRWDSGSTVRTGHWGHAQAERSRIDFVIHWLLPGARVINDIAGNLHLVIARVLRQTLCESLGGRGVDGEKVRGVRRGIYLGEIRRVAADARLQLVVEDAAYDAFLALEDQHPAAVVVRVDPRSALVEQGMDEGVGMVLVALACGKNGDNTPFSQE